MKNKTCRRIVLILLLNGSWVMGDGQQQPDSLKSYLEMAARNNPTVLQRYYEYEAALQKVPQVGDLPDPDLSLGFFLSPMELVSGNQVADIRLMQMFPWFGVIKAGKSEMSLMAKAKYGSFQDARLQVLYDVQRTWYELHKVRQNLLFSEKNITILQTIERLTISRYKSGPTGNNSSSSGMETTSATTQSSDTNSSGMQGMGANNTGTSSNQVTMPVQINSMSSNTGSTGLSDVYRIQIEIGDLQNNIALLQNRWNTLTAQFNSFINRPPGLPVTLPDTLVADTLKFSVQSLFDSALSNNPMLWMLEFEKQSLDARKEMVTRMSYPMVGVGLNYSVITKSEMSTSSMNGRDMIMPMITTTLPVYRKKYKAMQSEAELLKSANMQNYNAANNALQTEYYRAVQLYLDAERRTKLYAGQYQLASKTLEVMLISFSAGGSDLTDILRIRQQTLDYEYKQIEAVADFNTSIAWLNRLMAVTQ